LVEAKTQPDAEDRYKSGHKATKLSFRAGQCVSRYARAYALCLCVDVGRTRDGVKETGNQCRLL